MAIGAFLAKAAVGMLSARQQQKAAEKNHFVSTSQSNTNIAYV